MGCNYYAVKNRPSVSEPIHIGKCSIGWLFHFQAQDDPYHRPPVVWQTYDQVRMWLRDNTMTGEYVIMNEYDEIIPYDDFIALVEERQNDERCRNNPDNFHGGCRNVDGYRFSDGDFW